MKNCKVVILGLLVLIASCQKQGTKVGTLNTDRNILNYFVSIPDSATEIVWMQVESKDGGMGPNDYAIVAKYSLESNSSFQKFEREVELLGEVWIPNDWPHNILSGELKSKLLPSVKFGDSVFLCNNGYSLPSTNRGFLRNGFVIIDTSERTVFVVAFST